MGLHSNTVFKNSCLKVPVNPSNRLPSAKYERSTGHRKRDQMFNTKMSFDSTCTETGGHSQEHSNPLSFREFYRSIPDYEEVNHMSNKEFYMTLESLKQNQNKLLKKYNGKFDLRNDPVTHNIEKYISVGANAAAPRAADDTAVDVTGKQRVDKLHLPIRKSRVFSDTESPLSLDNNSKKGKTLQIYDNVKKGSKEKDRRRAPTPRYFEESDLVDVGSSWIENKGNEFVLDDDYFKKSYSLPTSPVKRRRTDAIVKTLSPKSPKIGEQFCDSMDLNHLRDIAKETHGKFLKEHKQFKANPVPIESRIPLYEKIMEDQELRRSISKLQSTAELQSQMKPFTFTERDERQNNLSKCIRLCKSNPQLTASSPSGSGGKTKSFRANPVPKNLFSNYVYDKMKEDDFYRALNRRIRAEEMLKASSLPPSMAKREKVTKTDYTVSPILQDALNNNNIASISSESSSRSSGKSKGKKGRRRSRGGSAKKKRDSLEKEYEQLKKEFIEEKSPRKANTAFSSEDLSKKIYGTNSSSSSGNQFRIHSASDIPSVNRSNLAAVLRMEATKKKIEAEMLKVLEEERFQSEVKWRDSVLRRKPAWSTIKNNHSSDIAMRLQTRKEEERLRREQFLHEMEMMYGRVHQQPLMFERAYPPRRRSNQNHLLYSKQSLREKILANVPTNSSYSKESHMIDAHSPSRSRKVSINETVDRHIGDYGDVYQSSEDDEDKASSDILESIGNGD